MEENYTKPDLTKEVERLMDEEGFDFGEAVKEAMANGHAAGGITGNKTYHQVRDQFMPMDSESMGYAYGGGVGSMMQPRQNYAIGGDIEQSDFSDIGLQTITNSGLPEYDDVAFKSGSALDRQINKLNQLEQMGFPQPNLEKLKQMDMKQFQKTGTPLSLSPELYATANNIMSDVSPTSTKSTQSYGRPSMRDITGEDLAVNEDVIDRGNLLGDSRISSEELGISGYGRPSMADIANTTRGPFSRDFSSFDEARMGAPSTESYEKPSMADIAGLSLPSNNVLSLEEIEEQIAANKNKVGLSSLMEFLPFGPRSISGMAMRGIGNVFGANSPLAQKMRGIDPATGLANTQAQYEQARSDRQAQSRTDSMIDRIANNKKTRSNPRDAGKTKAQKAAISAAIQDSYRGGGGGTSSGGKSIVCTAMYQTTGLQDWSKAMKVWYIYQKRHLSDAHQEGYHLLFKPFVKGMHKSKIIRAIGAHVAKHRTQELKHIMFNSKSDTLGKIYNKILQPICYLAGKIKSIFS